VAVPASLNTIPSLAHFTLAKPLMAGLSYPYDWGFIPSTKADDGDPLDVLVVHDAQTFLEWSSVQTRRNPGKSSSSLPSSRSSPSMKGKQERNDRVFAVPDRSPLETDLRDIRHLPAAHMKKLEQFFRATNALEDKKLEFLGWRGPAHASRRSNGCPVKNDRRANECCRLILRWSPNCFANTPTGPRCGATIRAGPRLMPRTADSLATLPVPLDALIAEGRLTEVPGMAPAPAGPVAPSHPQFRKYDEASIQTPIQSMNSTTCTAASRWPQGRRAGRLLCGCPLRIRPCVQRSFQ